MSQTKQCLYYNKYILSNQILVPGPCFTSGFEFLQLHTSNLIIITVIMIVAMHCVLEYYSYTPVISILLLSPQWCVCECSIFVFLQKVMTVDGEFITSFGSKVSAFGQLRRPNDVTTDAYGNVLVVDHGNGRVMVRESLLSCSSF